MESQNYLFCEQFLQEGNTVQLYQNECDIINQACENRGDNIEVKEYTKSMILNKRVNTSDKVSLGLMPGSAVFCYDIIVYFAAKLFKNIF